SARGPGRDRRWNRQPVPQVTTAPAVAAPACSLSRNRKRKIEPWGIALASMLATAVSGTAKPEMISEPVALLQSLDKITARVSKFEAPVGTPVQFGTLLIRVRDCEKSPPEETPESTAFLEIDEIRPSEVNLRVFSGWMFASSPALSALENPVYDVNLL